MLKFCFGLFHACYVCVFIAASQNAEVTSDSVSGVQDIILPMCRGFLPYEKTKLPNSFGHATQSDVFRYIQRHWAYMDYGCSNNFRLFVCSFYLPKYDPETNSTSMPCRETCNRARTRCRQAMIDTRSRWPSYFRCRDFPRKRSSQTCLRPLREPRQQIQYSYCTENTVPMCQALSYTIGSLPNLFLQRNITEISVELGNYNELIATGCHQFLTFFLCGTYVPYCVRNTSPFNMPCRELCNEVYSSCGQVYRQIYGNLRWPNKLQCHRYSASDSGRPCVMPGDFFSVGLSV